MMPNNIPVKLQVFLDYVNQAKDSDAIEVIREQLLSLVTVFGLPKVPVAEIVDGQFSCDQHDIPVRIYHPRPELALPLVIFFHGGGHACGDIETHDRLCRRVAVGCDCVVLSIAYRLAPEHPYPKGIEDCLAVVNQRRQVLTDMNVALDRVFLMGDSGGGNLAATVCDRLIAQNNAAITGLILIYPSTDFTLSHASLDHYANGYFLTKEKIQWYFDLYFPAQIDRQQASPLHFDQLHAFPPTYIALAEHDPLVDDGLMFAKKLQSFNVDVTQYLFEGMVHAFVHLETIVADEVDRLIASVAHFIRMVK